MLRAEEFDLVVLDVGLPDIDGFEVLRRMRARRSVTNVLVLTARDAVEDRVHGLDLGADDYLTKPFSVTEFEARVRALAAPSAPPVATGRSPASYVDVAGKRVRVHDKPVDLTPREWALLELLLARPNRVLSKEQIAESLFAVDETLSPNAIEVYVSRLRTKIGRPACASGRCAGSATCGRAAMSDAGRRGRASAAACSCSSSARCV